MAAQFASTTHSQISQSEAFLSLGLFDKTNFTSSYIVPEKWTIICTSKLQVLRCHLQVNLQMNLQVQFTSAFECSYKCSICLTIIFKQPYLFRQ